MNKLYSFRSIIGELRNSMRLSLPLIISELTYGSSTLLATVMIAHLGENELAANALVWSVFITLIVLFLGILTAVSVLASHSYGACDNKGAKTALIQGLILSVISSIPMMITMWFAPNILYWTGQDPEVIKIAIPFFNSLALCILPLNIAFTIEQFLIGIAMTKIVSFISILRVILEIILFYIFIFGKFGAPKLGLAGIGYGMTAAVIMTTILLGLSLHFIKGCSKYKIFSNIWKFNKHYLIEIIRVGLPSGAMYFIEVALFAVIAIIMGKLGNDVLAAHQIGYQCFMSALTLLFGTSQGTSVRIGHEVGRNNRDTLKLAAYVNIGFSTALMSIIAFFYVFFPSDIIALYFGSKLQQQSSTLIHYSTLFLPIAGILLLFESCRLVSVGALRGLKDTKAPMYISAIAFWLIAFPSAMILAFVFNFGATGIWIGLTIGLSSAGLILLVRLNRLIKRVNLLSLVTKEG